MESMRKETEVAGFFRGEVGFTRLLSLLIKKYASLGRLGGSVKLENLSAAEADSLSAFFRRNYLPQQSVVISFADFNAALQRTKFTSIHLVDLLSAYQGCRVLTNEEINRQKHEEKEKFFAVLQEKYPQVVCQKWLSAIRDKLPGTRRVHLAYEKDVLGLNRNLEVVLKALGNLPKQYERLPLFARRISGDPHALDTNTEIGRLFLDALSSSVEDKKSVEVGEEVLRSTVEEENELLYTFGLLRDDILNFVTCTGLIAMEEVSGKKEEVVYWRQAWQAGAVLNIPLREMLKVKHLYPALFVESGKKDVFVVENSGVFSSLIDIFTQQGLALPPLLCMHGQFKLACWVAIDRLVAGGSTIWYSGDFDPEGLFIAGRLLTRYPDSVRLWRYTVEDYMESLSQVSLGKERLNKLAAISEPTLTDVIEKIKDVGRAGYQEGVVEKLAADIEGMVFQHLSK